MKRILLGLLLVGGIALQGNAQVAAKATTEKNQTKATNEQAANRQAARLTKELGLNQEQRNKIYDFALVRLNNVRPLKDQQKNASSKEERQKIQADIKTHNQTFDNNVKSVLTPEQSTKYENMKKAEVERRKAKQESK